MHRMLVTADWHLSNKLPHAKVLPNSGGVTDRLADQILIIGEIINAAKEKKVDSVVVLGDVFDKRLLDAIVAREGARLIRCFAKIAPVYIMTGNHDAHSIVGDRSVVEFLEEQFEGNVFFLKPRSIVHIDGSHKARLHALPWCSLDVANERLEAMEKMLSANRGTAFDVLLLHHAVKGARDRGWVSEDGLEPERLDKHWGMILSGHFHDRQTFGKKGCYVSAPMEKDFGDSENNARGYSIVEFSGKQPKGKLTHYDVVGPRFHSVNYSSYSSSGDPDNNETNFWKPGDYVRFDISATHAEWKALKSEVDREEKALIAKGFRVVPARFNALAQHEDRLDLSGDSLMDEVLERYLDVTSYEGLDRKKLLEIARYALKEAEND